MVQKLYFKKMMTDEDVEKLESDYLDESFYKKINPQKWNINTDCDGYDTDGNLLFIFRKKCLDEDLSDILVDNLRDFSRKTHENRGASAGKLDRKALPKYVGKLVDAGKFRTGFISSKTGKKSKTKLSNLAPSNIIGYYDKPDRNLLGKGAKIRKTAFLKNNPDNWENVIPFFQNVDKIYCESFKDKTPNIYENQKKRAELVKDYVIPKTVFSTATVNYSWRTGIHKDKANYAGGLAILAVVKDKKNKNNYEGCGLGFPQYGFVVDIGDRDILITDNRIGWHGNTEFKSQQKEILEIDKNKLPNQRQIDNKWYFNRLSMVMYMRESMIELVNNASLLKNKKNSKKLKQGSLSIKPKTKKTKKNIKKN